MAGIYLHIPFCRKKCTYCDFHFSTSFNTKDKLLAAMNEELESRKEEFSNLSVDSIYFGGGTPSTLSQKEIEQLLNRIYKSYSVNHQSEITFEANPEDLTSAYLKGLKTAGINRLSLGLQSFDDESLRWMNRNHSSKQSVECIKLAQNEGINNISVDLIYGLPLLNNVSWKTTLLQAIALQINHISAYNLTVEAKTALAHQVNKGLVLPDDESCAKQFEILVGILTENGFDHYETSNFAKNEQYALHNSSYWKGEPYIGIGPSAHSFDGKKRRWNISNNVKYIAEISSTNYFEEEVLSEKDRINEYLLTGLRTKWGCSFDFMETHFGSLYVKQIKELLLPIASYFELKERSFKLNAKGKLLADKLTSDLFIL